MPVTTDMLLAPRGEVEPSYFPQDTPEALTARLTAYIDDGTTRVAAWAAANTGNTLDQDAAVRAWAMHRAMKQLHMDLSSNPARSDLEGQGGATYLKDQINTFAVNADYWLREYQALLSAARPVAATLTPTQGSTGAVSNRFVW